MQGVNLFLRVDVEVKPHARRPLALLSEHQLHPTTPYKGKSRHPALPGMQEPLIQVGPGPAQVKSEHIDIVRYAPRDAIHT